MVCGELVWVVCWVDVLPPDPFGLSLWADCPEPVEGRLVRAFDRLRTNGFGASVWRSTNLT